MWRVGMECRTGSTHTWVTASGSAAPAGTPETRLGSMRNPAVIPPRTPRTSGISAGIRSDVALGHSAQY